MKLKDLLTEAKRAETEKEKENYRKTINKSFSDMEEGIQNLKDKTKDIEGLLIGLGFPVRDVNKSMSEFNDILKQIDRFEKDTKRKYKL
jgi:hypothetical protein